MKKSECVVLDVISISNLQVKMFIGILPFPHLHVQAKLTSWPFKDIIMGNVPENTIAIIIAQLKAIKSLS